MLEQQVKSDQSIANLVALDIVVERIANFENPVELVNNMYGCHPDNQGSNYFLAIYGNL
jgi:hypothetical protein